MTSDEKKIINISKYKGGQVVTANNSKRPITRISKTMFVSHQSSAIVKLQNIYHITCLKKNLLSVSQLTNSGNYFFGPNDIKVY